MPTDHNPEFSEENIKEHRNTWCQTYVHVWSDLSKGVFDRNAVKQAADEHWQRSPQSDPVEVAAMEFIKAK